jgi:hypothetical protein
MGPMKPSLSEEVLQNEFYRDSKESARSFMVPIVSANLPHYLFSEERFTTLTEEN